MRQFAFLLVSLATPFGSPALAQDGEAAQPIDEPTVWDLNLGAHVSELPTEDYISYACGTNGGPPSLPVADWSGYQSCLPDRATGLHEVYFEYDNELELYFKALGLQTQAAVYEYTSIYSRPIIASAMFDADGFLMMLRLVTDPRVSTELREQAVTLGGFLEARYGVDSWACEDLAQIEGERPYRGHYEKQRCETLDGEGHRVVMETHNYRRPGHLAVNAAGLETEGQFWSETRLEVSAVGGIPNREERLAAIAARGEPEPTERELLIERAMDCPGCDLSGADLKRADLTGANLSGADLSRANLHGAILMRADLTGAILDDANLNGANLRLAILTGASLQKTLIYQAVLDGADLSQAVLNEARAGYASMSRTILVGAEMLAVDLRNARVTDADLRNANLQFSWAHDAQFIRTDLSGARLSDTVMWRVNLSLTKLVGAELLSADLVGANLRGADLRDANFSYARLTGAVMTDIITGGTVWANAALPAGFVPPE